MSLFQSVPGFDQDNGYAATSTNVFNDLRSHGVGKAAAICHALLASLDCCYDMSSTVLVGKDSSFAGSALNGEPVAKLQNGRIIGSEGRIIGWYDQSAVHALEDGRYAIVASFKS